MAFFIRIETNVKKNTMPVSLRQFDQSGLVHTQHKCSRKILEIDRTSPSINNFVFITNQNTAKKHAVLVYTL